ncbi:UNVERIFIED_CONTAM: hypothetical protein GTU68_015364 [Idotea baltica]|nr:hypothetical protein [Idotea baltica]
MLTHHILKKAELNVGMAGNIGDSFALQVANEDHDKYVLELSSFQLDGIIDFAPHIAVITNISPDHLDRYDNKYENYINSKFRITMNQTAEDYLIYDVSGELFIRKGLPIKGITYGIEEDADYDAKNIRIENGSYIFDIQTPSELFKNIEINIPGRHNVLNTVVALAMANSYGVPLLTIAKALKTFKGIQRRFNYKIKTDELVLIDDYAHHPTEINAVAGAVKELFPSDKILAVFQPHLFSRTRDFIDDFADSLSKFDELILLDIYPAREKPIEGVTSEWLLGKIESKKKQISTKENLISKIKASDARIIVMIGAGDIGVLIEEVYLSLK